MDSFFPPSMKSDGEYACLRLLLSARCSGPFRTCRAVSTAPISSSLRSLLTGLSSGCLVSPISSWYTLNRTAEGERDPPPELCTYNEYSRTSKLRPVPGLTCAVWTCQKESLHTRWTASRPSLPRLGSTGSGRTPEGRNEEWRPKHEDAHSDAGVSTLRSACVGLRWRLSRPRGRIPLVLALSRDSCSCSVLSWRASFSWAICFVRLLM